VSQQRQERTWPARGPGGGGASRPGGAGSSWSGNRIVVTGQSQRGEPLDPRAPAPPPDGARGGRVPAGQRSGARLTARGALLGMFVLSFLGILISTWLDWSPLAGGSFVVGCAAAAWWTKPRDLLSVVISPPLLFFCALLATKALTATGNTLISIAEGTVLTLADVGPWMLVGVAVSLVIAWFRGLPRCVRDLRGSLQADRARRAPTNSGR
jgi:hypothetical protein